MLDQQTWGRIAEAISQACGRSIDPAAVRPVGGGCINQSFALGRHGAEVFVKLNDVSQRAMFEAEAAGLRELGKANAIRVPEPYALGETGAFVWLGIEFLNLGIAGPDSQAALGRQLARLHRVTTEQFGWDRDNTIGSTPQRNPRCDDWIEFLGSERLGYQFQLAAERGVNFKGRESLLGALPAFFDGYEPRPSLLHGDLWSGNVGFTAEGDPAIFDPAVYYGDREAEFGIIEMFGGFTQAFYRAYREEFPLEAGFDTRKDLYLLYHQLNHFNLFGNSYAGSVESTLDRLLRGIKS